MSKTKPAKSIKPPASSERVETYMAPPPPTNGYGGVSRFYEADAFGRRNSRDKPTLLIESR